MRCPTRPFEPKLPTDTKLNNEKVWTFSSLLRIECTSVTGDSLMTAGNCHCSQDQTQITPSWQSNGISLYAQRLSLLRENMTDRKEKVFHGYLWTSPVQEWQRQPQLSRWHNASGWCWSCGASGARFWWGQTCDLRDTSSIQSRSFKLSTGQKDRTEAQLNSSDWVVDSHVCQLMTVGILSLVTPSDANYTIIARLHSGCI